MAAPYPYLMFRIVIEEVVHKRGQSSADFDCFTLRIISLAYNFASVGDEWWDDGATHCGSGVRREKVSFISTEVAKLQSSLSLSPDCQEKFGKYNIIRIRGLSLKKFIHHAFWLALRLHLGFIRNPNTNIPT